MFRRMKYPLLVLTVFALCGSVFAIDRSGFDELTTVMDSASVVEAEIFAPKVFKKAAKEYARAQEAVQSNRKQKTVDKYVSKAREYVENAIKTTSVTNLSLQEYLEPRNKAKSAQAPSLVAELYNKAEMQFLKGTAKVESGDVKNGLKEAAKATPLFDYAEIEAIRVEILGAADRLIEKAEAGDAAKFALSTLDKARTARTKANAIITNDRYNRTDATKEASRAEYEARHASNIAMSVRSLKRNDQAWEKLILVYEIQMNRIGETIGQSHLPFDNGPLAAADSLISYITDLQSYSKNVKGESESLSSGLTSGLQSILSKLGGSSESSDPVRLASAVSTSVDELIVQKNELETQLASKSAKLDELAAENADVSTQLAARVDREAKFKKAKRILNPSEGEVLFNASNDIVLRLSGLSFEVNSSDLKDEHMGLLGKVEQVIEMFPEATLVIEGHTDANGDPAANVTLSEKRAFAVMQYLRQSMLIPAGKIQSIGYGADKPVASNQTEKGRSKNRRIDVLIMQ